MGIEVFKPQVDMELKYAVAVPAEGGIVMPVQSYETMEQLREGYKTWQQFASGRGITKPVPIEFVDKTGKCRVLTDLLSQE
jgi:hypothetical protein